MQNETKKTAEGGKINNFVQDHRKGIFVSLGAIIVLFVGVVIFLSLQDVFNKKAIAEVEELAAKYDEIRYNVNDENYADQVEDVLTELKAFANKKRGYAASKAWSMIANIYSSKEDWAACEEAWLKAAKAGIKTYLAPISFFNAAAAAEEQGKIEEAVEYLQKCLDHPFEFTSAARAQFNIGRLYEQAEKYPEALEAYRAVLINWQDIPIWQHFARSRIIAIEIQ